MEHTTHSSARSRTRISYRRLVRDRRVLVVAVSAVALLLFLSTVQLGINSNSGPYTTDVGEIQNALPRWGTIHFTGYPLYTALGSLFVNGLRLLGVSPAFSAGLYSALWGALSVGLLAWLILLFDVPPPAAAVAALLYALARSMWIDASLAELHTMTMALTFAALIAAVRFSREAGPVDLYWLAFLSGQGVAHQRAFAFLAPALLFLVLPHWRVVLRHWWQCLGLALLGPLTYIYLPLVDWLGSEWVFSAPGTWDGFWALVLDTKADRIVSIPESPAVLWERASIVLGLLNDDWPWPLWVTGLVGLTFLGRARLRERLALTATWLVYLLLSIIIWEGTISDALLAVKLPVIAMSAVGLGFLAHSLWQWRPLLGRTAVAAGLVLALLLAITIRPSVLAITRDAGAEETIALVEAIPSPADGRPVTLMALWGNDFWQLAYAQEYQGSFPALTLVDHNADFREIVDRGDHLYTLSRTLYARPVSWWEERLQGPVALSQPSPRIVELSRNPRVLEPAPDPVLLLENGIAIREAQLQWWAENTLQLSLEWQALQSVAHDYSVAVHLVRHDPPAGPDDILAQTDRAHPVRGWYPTSQWQAGEIVSGQYLIEIPPGAEPVAVRVSMYRQVEQGFENTSWLSLPVPPR